jgi:hypothetical protein
VSRLCNPLGISITWRQVAITLFFFPAISSYTCDHQRRSTFVTRGVVESIRTQNTDVVLPGRRLSNLPHGRYTSHKDVLLSVWEFMCSFRTERSAWNSAFICCLVWKRDLSPCYAGRTNITYIENESVEYSCGLRENELRRAEEIEPFSVTTRNSGTAEQRNCKLRRFGRNIPDK